MEYVEPIRKITKIREIKAVLKKKSPRDYLLFVMGINTGLRIGELLSLKGCDVMDEEEEIKPFLYIDHQQIYLNDQVRKAIQYHFKKNTFSSDHFIFSSTRGEKSITRQQAYRIINQAAKQVGIEEKIGTHTLRKTFGYHALLKGVAISLIQNRFHQATPSETLKYIGIEKTEPQKIDVNL